MLFRVNGISWTVIFVNPHSRQLVDRTGKATLATTSPTDCCIYISNDVKGGLLRKVVRHELGHVVMISYGLIFELHRLIRDGRYIEIEEFICNFIAEYGKEIDELSRKILSA